MSRSLRVAVVGSGIAGLSAVHHLAQQPGIQPTLIEAGAHFGGHANTVDVSLPDATGQVLTHGVDTGFLVFNERTYPGLIGLFEQLGVATAASDMSFSVQAPGLEWSGSNLDTVFAQRSNLLRPRFWGMLADLLRFNRLCTTLAEQGADADLLEPLQDFLGRHRFGQTFQRAYLLPMLGCIWSCPTDQMLRFPVGTMVRFCHNHGLIQVNQRPRWFTVAGGSRQYVHKLLAAVPDRRLNSPVRRILRGGAQPTLMFDHGAEVFDAVLLATHADTSLALLSTPTAREQAVLGAFRYQPNTAVLHTDLRCMPRRRKAWAAWNYQTGTHTDPRVCLHYWINALQPLPFAQPVIVSLNPLTEPDPSQVLGRFEYEHPVFDAGAVAAQAQVASVQGIHGCWFAGAWTRYGFHEDGFQSGLSAAESLLQALHRQPALAEAA